MSREERSEGRLQAMPAISDLIYAYDGGYPRERLTALIGSHPEIDREFLDGFAEGYHAAAATFDHEAAETWRMAALELKGLHDPDAAND